MALSPSARRAWPERAIALPLLAALMALTLLAWLLLGRLAGRDDALAGAGVPMTMGMAGRLGVVPAALFLLVWLVMMTAMMFPSVWPALLLYARVARSGARVTLFTLGYLLTWESFGLLTYAGYVGVGALLAARMEWMDRLPLLTAAALIAAGLYQFTPLKRVCLAHCQGPLDYLMAHWCGGTAGALRMGLGHGAYCLGCCWGLMLALAALGVMDLRWMASVAVLIAVEKLGPRRAFVPSAVGAVLLLLGAALALSPGSNWP
jgi:predicted metal-binding membrane protein